MANTPPPLVPGHYMGGWEYSGEYAKTTAYTIPSPGTGTLNCALFTNAGATGAVTITLPAIAANQRFVFRCIADQNFAVTSAEGTNIVIMGNASASTLTFQTPTQRIGGGLLFESSADGTKWYVTFCSGGTNPVTVT